MPLGFLRVIVSSYVKELTELFCVLLGKLCTSDNSPNKKQNGVRGVTPTTPSREIHFIALIFLVTHHEGSSPFSMASHSISTVFWILADDISGIPWTCGWVVASLYAARTKVWSEQFAFSQAMPISLTGSYIFPLPCLFPAVVLLSRS